MTASHLAGSGIWGKERLVRRSDCEEILGESVKLMERRDVLCILDTPQQRENQEGPDNRPVSKMLSGQSEDRATQQALPEGSLRLSSRTGLPGSQQDQSRPLS